MYYFATLEKFCLLQLLNLFQFIFSLDYLAGAIIVMITGVTTE